MVSAFKVKLSSVSESLSSNSAEDNKIRALCRWPTPETKTGAVEFVYANEKSEKNVRENSF